ncbi:unnamed protein product [Meganyctiphanes norvegica]|uniref:Uncharacterized protein n=1 Tax=Meganyctiphanes norvegica TaxID=48144 RepID=A0AAV2Q9U7_MEGNR
MRILQIHYMKTMEEKSSAYTSPTDNLSNCFTETVTEANLATGVECKQTLLLSSSEQSEISDESDSDASPIMDVENISHSGSLGNLEIIVPKETNSEAVLEITEIIDDAKTVDIELSIDDSSISGSSGNLEIIVPRETNSEPVLEITEIRDDAKTGDIELSTDDSSFHSDNLIVEDLQYSIDPPSINDDSEFHVDTAKSYSNADLSILSHEMHSINSISENVTSDSIPDLEIIPNSSKEESTYNKITESPNENHNHSTEFGSTARAHDDPDYETSSPYEVYARHMFNAPIPPPRRKKKLRLEQNISLDGVEPDIDVAPRSKRLCRFDDFKPSDLEVDDPSLDISTSMDTAILVEDIPSMDTTLYIDGSLTMESGDSVSPARSYESISDVESLPEIPLCLTSTQRPLMLPSVKNMNLNE